MEFFRLYLIFRFVFSRAALSVPLDIKIAPSELGDHASLAKAFRGLVACDFQNESLSLLQVRFRGSSQKPSLYPQSWKRNRMEDLEGEEELKQEAEQEWEFEEKLERQEGVGGEVGPRGRVETGVEAVAAFDSRDAKQRVVWINAFPRSGSTLLLSLVSQVDIPVFALFEPCAKYDDVGPWLSKEGCGAVLSQLATCNFTGIKHLHHWSDPGTLRNGASEDYSPTSASSACKSAGLVVLKTVTWGHNVASEAIPFLQANPHVYAIDVVRDPRSMYASAMFAEDFYTDPERGHNVRELIDLCDDLYRSMEVSYPRMLRIVYERFVQNPAETAKSIFSFIAATPELGAVDVNQFLKRNFNARNCEDMSSYSICKQDSMKPLERYKALPWDMSQVFRTTQSCVAVAEFYGYDLNDGLREG